VTADPGLRDKVAVVTGGARGIGAATASLFRERGARVIVVDRDAEPGADSVRADVSDIDALDRAVAGALDGAPLDICVANAGHVLAGTFEETELSDWQAVINGNLLSLVATFKVALKHMRGNATGGRLLATSSVAGIRPAAGEVAYAASKAGVNATVHALALELGGRGITVNAVAPSTIDTGFNRQFREQFAAARGLDLEEIEARHGLNAIPVGRWGQPIEVAAILAFLASDAAGFITGQTITIDGGKILH
jgi:NAD(P)-dependent dehydrogenase (short-subunit alcohol dehydrogenase family)